MDGSLALQDVLDTPLRHARMIMADLDGCLVAGGRPRPGAAELVAACGGRMWIVSNNSSDTAATLAERLASQGLDIPAARILLAGDHALAAIAARHPGALVALFAAAPIIARAEALGLRPDRTRPEVALLARDPGFGLDALAALAALALRGVPVWLANPDPYHPGPDGAPVPETGALWAALTAIVPVTPAVCLAKPAPDLLNAALAAADVAPQDAIFIGDTPATDGAAARAAGVPFLQIRRPGPVDGDAPC